MPILYAEFIITCTCLLFRAYVMIPACLFGHGYYNVTTLATQSLAERPRFWQADRHAHLQARRSGHVSYLDNAFRSWNGRLPCLAPFRRRNVVDVVDRPLWMVGQAFASTSCSDWTGSGCYGFTCCARPHGRDPGMLWFTFVLPSGSC